MIIATAGHVDHGKTALVKALTGKDTDTLEEEKRRGLTITPGFAYFDVTRSDAESVRIGFVDLPGHHQFIHNMLSGVAGVDAVLLVIAADEGIMPQTVEHLRIMDLLNVRHGVLAVTKTDRVDAASMAILDDALGPFTRGTCMEHAAVIRTSSKTGEGIDELRDNLTRLTAFLPERPIGGNFRMTVDRAFTLKGIGVIATGTVHAGRVETHEEIVVAPASIHARIRSIYSEDRPASAAAAGHRCAINLGGIELSQVRRGDWLTTSDAGSGTARLDIRLKLSADVSSTLRHWTPVHVFHGATHVTGRVALLEDRVLEPGNDQLAQLVLDEPIVAVHGDTCILRNQASDETLGAADVLDIAAPTRTRAKKARLMQLRRMQVSDPAGCIQAMLADSLISVALEPFRLNWNLTPNEADDLFRESGIVFIETDAGRRGLHPDQWRALRGEIRVQIGRWHEHKPEAAGMRLNELRTSVDETVETPVLEAAVRESIRQGDIEQSGPFLHTPDFKPRSDMDTALWKDLRRHIVDAGDRPPTVQELAEALGMDPEPVTATLKKAQDAGLAVRVEHNRYFLPGHIEAMARLLAELSEDGADGLVTTAAYRDASGLGRNLSIAVLEYFDSTKLTRRIGNARRLLKPVD